MVSIERRVGQQVSLFYKNLESFSGNEENAVHLQMEKMFTNREKCRPDEKVKKD